MATDNDVGEQLFEVSQALVKQAIRRHQLAWNDNKIEDATQTLVLAGWQVYSDTRDLGLAKNRIRSRLQNVLRKDARERRHEPKSESTFSPAEHDGEPAPSILERSAGDDPAVIAELRDYVSSMRQQQRDVVLLKGARMTNQEIADELSIGLRTVERELAEFRKKQEEESRNG